MKERGESKNQVHKWPRSTRIVLWTLIILAIISIGITALFYILDGQKVLDLNQDSEIIAPSIYYYGNTNFTLPLIIGLGITLISVFITTIIIIYSLIRYRNREVKWKYGGKTLNDFINVATNKGMDEEDIKDELLSKLDNFVREAVVQGHSRQDIRASLLEGGWPQEFIDKHLDDLFGRTVNKNIEEKKEVKEKSTAATKKPAKGKEKPVQAKKLQKNKPKKTHKKSSKPVRSLKQEYALLEEAIQDAQALLKRKK